MTLSANTIPKQDQTQRAKSVHDFHFKYNFPLCLAPMVGISHVALRQVARSYLPKEAKTIWPTEMLNSRKLPKEDFAKTPEVMRAEREEGLVPQILGNEEVFIAASVEKLVNWGAEGIDINMGCPVQKALRHNYGVALMGDPVYAAEVVRITKKNSPVPVSVKLRAASDFNKTYLKNFVSGLIAEGADWICLHPRTAEQKRRGSADWEQLAWLKNEISVPLIGNGDVQTEEDVLKMLSQTGVDMVMSGRALAARPWLMWQVGESLGFAPPVGKEGQKAPRTREEEGHEYGKSLLALLTEMEKYFGENLTLRKFRFHVRTTHVWLLFGHLLYSKITSATSVLETRQVVEDFFSKPVEMLPKTDLRQ
jgi:tRNA-dihydrouridine synthase B